MRKAMLALPLAYAVPEAALGQANNPSVVGQVYVGQEVVPPDVVDTTVDQNRLERLVAGDVLVGYTVGPVILRVGGGFRFYANSDYNRYPLLAEAQYDLPLANNGRTKLRIKPSFECVLANDGRVFDRTRLDLQLIHRASKEHTTTVRLRYGYRNQNDDRFVGYDQSEWLTELRHLWRPGGGPTRITGSLLGMFADADARRFSYDGYGARLILRSSLSPRLDVYGRFNIAQYNYRASFSRVYDYNRRDTRVGFAGGLERRIGPQFALFGEAGYIDNASNVPVREYRGFVGRIGLRFRR